MPKTFEFWIKKDSQLAQSVISGDDDVLES